MAKYALSFVELHGPLFMSGSNMGQKINAAQRGAKLLMDDERGIVWVYFKNKVAFVPLSNVASADIIDIPDDIKEYLGIAPPKVEAQESVPPAIAKARRGRPPMQRDDDPVDTGYYSPPTLEELDRMSPEDRKAAVQAASANAHKAHPPVNQDDRLIQESRAAAMGVKLNKTNAQVQTAHQVGQSAAITGAQGKPKAINHAQLAAQVKSEEKTGI